MSRGVLLCSLLLSLLAGPARAAETAGGRHADLACSDCHPSGGPEAEPCSRCHGQGANLHPAGITPSWPIPDAFPLDLGRITCRTCHRLHAPTGPHLLRGFAEGLARDVRGFCYACHGENLARTNPHGGELGKARCAFCHASAEPKSIAEGFDPSTRAGAERLCDFCHDMRSKDHPRNVDPILDLPKALPRGPRGEVTCITCHAPHGSSSITHHIREEYAVHFERGTEADPHVNERIACRACHVEPFAERITRENHELRLHGDANLLCVSCHVRARSHHPVGTPLPEAMTRRLEERARLPLDSEGRTTCVTCHTNNCETGQQRRSIRHYDGRKNDLSLCWMCHVKEEWEKTNPHRKVVDETTEGCVFCHDRLPVKGLEKSADLYFISDVRMICLRCHEKLSDLDRSHIGKRPPADMAGRLEGYARDKQTAFPLDRAGRLTCTTCHNSHFSANEAKYRTRIPSKEMCTLCHARN